MDVRRARPHTGIGCVIRQWAQFAAEDAERSITLLTADTLADRSPHPAEPRGIRRAMAQSGAVLFHATYPQILAPGRVATVLTLYDTIQLSRGLPARTAASLLLRSNVRRSTAILTCSDHARSSIVAAFGVDPARVHVFPIGVEARVDAPARPRGDRPYLLYVGNAKAHKNVEQLLRWSAQELPRRGVRLVAVLPGQAVARLEGTRDPSVELRSGLSDTDLESLRSGALASVSLAEGEGFGLPPLEAAAWGVPALLHDSGAHREVMGHGATYCSLRRDSFAAALDDLLARHEDLARAALTRARHYTWSASYAAVTSLYDQLLEGGTTPRHARRRR